MSIVIVATAVTGPFLPWTVQAILLATGETLRWQQVLHSRRLGRNPAGGVDDSHPITRLFAASQRFQFIAECLSAVTPSKVGTDCEELISQDGPILAIELGRRIKRESRFLVAAEFFRRRVIGAILRRYDQIPIRRGRGDEAALDDALTVVKGGGLLAIAPEGTVNGDAATLLRLRTGVARVALPTGAPVIPVGIWGTQQRWPKSGLTWRRPWRPDLAIVFGEPILPAGDIDDDRDVEDFRDRLRVHLERQVARARALTDER